MCYERITISHAPELSAELCDPLVYAFVDDRVPPTPDELLASFSRMEAGPPASRASETWIDFAVRLKQSGLAIGRVQATVREDRAEMAYVFGRRHWGFGYAQEAMEWLQIHLRDAHDTSRFWATVSPENQRSIALLTRLGYTRMPKSCWPAKLLSYNDGDSVYFLEGAAAAPD